MWLSSSSSSSPTITYRVALRVLCSTSTSHPAAHCSELYLIPPAHRQERPHSILCPDSPSHFISHPPVGCPPDQENLWKCYLKYHVFLKFRCASASRINLYKEWKLPDLRHFPVVRRQAIILDTGNQPILPLWAMQEVEAVLCAIVRHVFWSSDTQFLLLACWRDLSPYLLSVPTSTEAIWSLDKKTEVWGWVRRSSSKLDTAVQCWWCAGGWRAGHHSMVSVSILSSDGLMIAVSTINVSIVLSCSALSRLEQL